MKQSAGPTSKLAVYELQDLLDGLAATTLMSPKPKLCKIEMPICQGSQKHLSTKDTDAPASLS